MEQLGSKGESLKTGIYYGKALLRGNVYNTVVSVGWNPFYKNVKKTVEAHLIAQLDDFYDEEISSKLLCIFDSILHLLIVSVFQSYYSDICEMKQTSIH